MLGRSGPLAKGASVQLCVTDSQLVITLEESRGNRAAVTHRTAFELEEIVPSLKTTSNMLAFMGGEGTPVRWALQTPQAAAIKAAMLDSKEGQDAERMRRVARATMPNDFISQEEEATALEELRAGGAASPPERWASPRGKAAPAGSRPLSQVQPSAGRDADIYDLPANDRARCGRHGSATSEGSGTHAPLPPPPPPPLRSRSQMRTNPSRPCVMMRPPPSAWIPISALPL